MKVLILGGGGFIGRNLVSRLLSDGHRVGVFCRQPLPFDSSSLDVFLGDFSDLTPLEGIINNYEVVIHLISGTVPSTSMLDPVYDVEINLINTVKFIQLMNKNKIKKIIFLSSGGTIYKPNNSLISESCYIEPACSYGVVKVAIENYLNLFQKIYDLEVVILRVANPYGPYASKTHIQGVVGNFMKKIKIGMPIEVWGDGTDIRDFIFIDDLISAINKSLYTSNFGTYNIGSGIGTSVNQLIEIIEGITQKKALILYKNSLPYQVKSNVLDITKAKNLLNWQPKVDLIEGCALYNKCI